MRILPDRHFKEHYSEHYNANYEKISAKLAGMSEKRQNRTHDSPDVVKYKIVGGIATGVILGVFITIGLWLSSMFNAKEQQIASLEQSINTVDSLIKKYQIINGDAMREQFNEVVVNVAKIQTEYSAGSFSDESEAIADRYLGSFNNNWSDSEISLTAPFWRGYINKAHEFDDTAEFVFILYDAEIPKMIAVVRYDIDINGNVGTIKSVRKTWLV